MKKKIVFGFAGLMFALFAANFIGNDVKEAKAGKWERVYCDSSGIICVGSGDYSCCVGGQLLVVFYRSETL